MSLERYRQKRDFGRTPEPAGAPAPSGAGPSPGPGTTRASSGAGSAQAAPARYVVQRHRATRLHYDLRLEIDGVLASWAVPRGPSMRPLERRMAAHTEDHPIEYLTFEGTIPAGQYGAGDMIVWDWGTWRPEEGGDPAAAVRDGELKLVLEGERLRGRFVLVRTRSSDGRREDWLLIHKRDETADPGWDIDAFPVSVRTGRTNDEVRAGVAPRFEAQAPSPEPPPDLAKAVEAPMPDFIEPMAATSIDHPFNGEGWLFELKLDGYRVECVIRDGRLRTWTRNHQDAARWFPSFAAAPPTWLAARDAIVDGEMVALGEDGHPDFSLLQDVTGLRGLAAHRGERRVAEAGRGRGRAVEGASGGATSAERAPTATPAERPGEDAGLADAPAATPGEESLVYFAFDLLHLDGRSLLAVPLIDRKRLLATLLRSGQRVRLLPHVEVAGASFHEEMKARGLEGSVAKRLDSRYEPGRRSRAWLKVKATREQEFVVVGYEPGHGSHADLGSLLVATHEGRGWRYAGAVGSGLDTRTRAEFRTRLDAHALDAPPVEGAPGLPMARWSEPREVVRVGFSEWTSDGLLRHPVFRGREIGRDPGTVRRETTVPVPVTGPGRTKRDEAGAPGPGAREALTASIAVAARAAGSGRGLTAASASDPERPQAATADELAALDALGVEGTWRVGGRELPLTNLDKVLFPEAGYTKRDLVRFYASVASVILPHLLDRPLTTHRWPDGVAGKSFWQKQLPSHAPAWLARWEDPEARAGRSHTYVLADQVATLAWLAGQAVIDIHPMTGRLPDLWRPSYALIDIDPGSRTTWEEVLVLARLFRTALAHVGATGFPKVTGKRGIQVWVPVTPRYTFDDTRDWVERLSRAVGAAVPELVSWDWAKADREGRARLDFTQNAPIRTLVAPYAVRPVARASVSMPIEWHELDDPGLRPDGWDLRSALPRIAERGDLFAGALVSAQDLPPI